MDGHSRASRGDAGVTPADGHWRPRDTRTRTRTQAASLSRAV